VAGTHGVTRPGGAALNSGQVGAIRAAERIAHDAVATAGEPGAPALAALRAVGTELAASLSAAGPVWIEVRDEVRARMSDEAGFLCDLHRLPAALAAAGALRRRTARDGVRADAPRDAINALRWRQHALASEAILAALARYAAAGGGSRGARAMLGRCGQRVEASREDLGDLHILPERPEDRGHKLVVRLVGDDLVVDTRPLRSIESLEAICFERHWPDFLTGSLLRDDYRHA
jgi:succinate dehydrogenase / fumarate reductase, flavoprotein subunit